MNLGTHYILRRKNKPQNYKVGPRRYSSIADSISLYSRHTFATLVIIINSRSQQDSTKTAEMKSRVFPFRNAYIYIEYTLRDASLLH
jgi:hypothetical protein